MSVSIPSGTYPLAAPLSFAGLVSVGQAVWRTLSRMGAMRAAGRMRLLADQCEASNPSLARQLRESADAGFW